MNFLEGWNGPLAGLLMARLAGMTISLPLWGSPWISWRWRLGFCFILATALNPFVSLQTIPDSTNSSWVGLAISELFAGAIYGLAIQIVFQSMMIAGELIGLPIGIRAPRSNQKSGGTFGSATTEGESTMGRMFHLLAAAIFVSIGGPGMAMDGLFQTLATHPLGTFAHPENLVPEFLSAIPGSLLLGLKIALPVLFCQWSALLAVGLIGRLAPQISFFHFGMPLVMLVTLIAILLSVGTTAILFENSIREFLTRPLDPLPANSLENR